MWFDADEILCILKIAFLHYFFLLHLKKFVFYIVIGLAKVVFFEIYMILK